MVLSVGARRRVPDHSAFSKNRHGRFRGSDLLRRLFETVVARCMKERLVGGEREHDRGRRVSPARRGQGRGSRSNVEPRDRRIFSVLDNAVFGASRAEGDLVGRSDGTLHGRGQHRHRYVCSDNDLVDLKHAAIMDVEATTAIRQAEVGAAKTMLDRTAEQFDVQSLRLVADYGSAEMPGRRAVEISDRVAREAA
jgi:hypothetical protein